MSQYGARNVKNTTAARYAKNATVEFQYSKVEVVTVIATVSHTWARHE